MHLKGMRDSTPTGLLTGHSDVTNDVAVGTGKIDYVPDFARGKKSRREMVFHRGRIAVVRTADSAEL